MAKRPTPPTHVRDNIVGILIGFAGRDSYITIPVTFVKFCDNDIVIAALFSQILYWTGVTDDPEGWIAKSYEDWHEEICLTRSQVDRSTKALGKVGLETKKARSRWHNFAPTMHYRFDREILGKAANAFFDDPVQNRQKMKGQRKSNLPLSSRSNLLEISKSDLLNSSESETLGSNKSYKETMEKRIEKTLSASDDAQQDQSTKPTKRASSKASQKSAHADNSQADEASATTPSSPVPLTPSPAPRKKPLSRLERIINDAWRKGAVYLLAQLVGNAQQKGRKEWNVDPGMSEAEVLAFGRWYYRKNGALNLPEEPRKVYEAVIGFRSEDTYDALVQEAVRDIPLLYPNPSDLPIPTPAAPVASREAHDAVYARLNALGGTFDNLFAEEVSS